MSETQHSNPFEFDSAGEFEPPPESRVAPVLERLGPSPFPRSGFPLLGFLATVYDHVADYARKLREEGPR